MKLMVPLRDYQLEMLGQLDAAWRQHRSVMVQMPTGTGKTVLLAEAIRKLKIENEKLKIGSPGAVLVVAHRKELIEQIRRSIVDHSPFIIVESIQKLSKHIDEVEFEPSLVVVDEAHHALAKTYRMLWERWPKARFLGLTATPCRLSGESFTHLFDVLLQSWSIQTFIDRGVSV